jgi:hypothetical protein
MLFIFIKFYKIIIIYENNVIKKFKNESEFYSIVGMKWKIFNKINDILINDRTKNKWENKHKLSVENQLMITFWSIERNIALIE